jgi:hypothetical protein
MTMRSLVLPYGEPEPALPVAGWYPDPQGSGLLRWWDGTAWADARCWPVPARRPRPGGMSAWLAGPAASPLLAVVAVVTAIGWAGAAVVMVAVAAAGHPLLPAWTVDVSLPLLPLADGAARLAGRAGRAGAAPPAGATRAMRRAARRARRASVGPSFAVKAVRWLVRRHRQAFASLPRPAARFLAAAIWSTFGAYAWVMFEAAWHPHGWSGDVGVSAGGQQLAAVVWMWYLITWSGSACRRLGRTRVAARMMVALCVGRRSGEGGHN